MMCRGIGTNFGSPVPLWWRDYGYGMIQDYSPPYSPCHAFSPCPALSLLWYPWPVLLWVQGSGDSHNQFCGWQCLLSWWLSVGWLGKEGVWFSCSQSSCGNCCQCDQQGTIWSTLFEWLSSYRTKGIKTCWVSAIACTGICLICYHAESRGISLPIALCSKN